MVQKISKEVAMAAGKRIKEVAKEIMSTFAAVGGIVLLLQVIPDFQSQAAKNAAKDLQDEFDEIDIKEVLAVHRELKRNAKD